VLNAGNGAGYFFNQILHDLGADVSNSIHLTPSGSFPKSGVPNPEYSAMIDETMRVCEECDADIGIMLDTDADRCGFIVPNTRDEASACRKFEALNRNRLIALLAVIFQSSCPGCTFVTDR
jgi:phosphomannomutase